MVDDKTATLSRIAQLAAEGKEGQARNLYQHSPIEWDDFVQALNRGRKLRGSRTTLPAPAGGSTRVMQDDG